MLCTYKKIPGDTAHLPESRVNILFDQERGYIHFHLEKSKLFDERYISILKDTEHHVTDKTF